MSETPSPGERIAIGALEFNPRIASRLGRYLGQITQFELCLTVLFGWLMQAKDFDAAEAVFGRIMNISTRIDIIEALVELRPDHYVPTKKQLGELVSDARAINTLRNEYVHGAYHIDERTKEVVLITWFTSSSRKKKVVPLSPKKIDDDVEMIHRFGGKMLSLVGFKFSSFPTGKDERPTLP